ncbi:oligosaccharide flippase family protein [Tunicatimonas pelagia]|uniref:oligosaccharide flippase family protein n=1 Tax=Tunicatimonas pelagia TaxID=931531 RepID=UPI002665A297|nr:oligosaccharide flippase family protein [Tunicatimonas pelagia]WKN43252.1 oligosaccharide flippase family protein [Tunicatimonas pelagia]
MGIIQRQTIKSTVYIYAGVIVGFITTAVIFPRVLTSAQIGVTILLGSWSSVFAQGATLGFNGATVKFFSRFRNKEKNHHGFLFLLLLVALGGFLLFLGLYYLLKPWLIATHDDSSPLFRHSIYLIIPFTFLILLFLMLDTYNRVLYNATTGTLLKELFLRLFILLGTLLFFFNLLNFNQFAAWYVGAQGGTVAMLIVFLIWQKEFNPMPDFSRLDSSLIRGMASLSLFSFLTGFSALAILRIDSIMIGSYLTEAEVGIYAMNINFATLVMLPTRALRNIAPTLIADAFNNDDLDAIGSIYQKSTITQLTVGLLLMLGLWVNTETIYAILTPEYRTGIYVVLFIGLSNVARMGGGLSDAIVGYSKHYKMNTVFNAGWLLLIVLTNLIFIPTLGITGAALASLVSVVVITVVRFWFVYRKFGMQPYRFEHLLVIVLAALTYFLISLLPTFSPFWIDFLLKGSLVVAIYGSAVYFLNVSPEINALVNSTAQRIRSLF